MPTPQWIWNCGLLLTTFLQNKMATIDIFNIFSQTLSLKFISAGVHWDTQRVWIWGILESTGTWNQLMGWWLNRLQWEPYIKKTGTVSVLCITIKQTEYLKLWPLRDCLQAIVLVTTASVVKCFTAQFLQY